jgi:glycosyltransferase EpsF
MTDNETTNKRCIVHIIGHIQGGGVEHIVAQYLNELIPSEKYKYAVIAYDDPDTQYQQLIRKGLLFYKIPSFKHWKKYESNLLAILKDWSCDIVHCHLGALAYFPLTVAKKAGVSIRILHNHTSGSIHEPIRTIAKLVLKRFSILQATYYCACSQYAASWFFGKEQGSKVKIIQNSIDLLAFNFNPIIREKTRRELGVEDFFVLGFVGRLATAKNPFFLISLLSEVKTFIPKVKLIIIGDGDLRKKLEKVVCKYGLENNIMFLGIRDDVVCLYQAMDVFLLPSFYEGLGIVGIEAQAAGLPCLFSDKVPQEVLLTEHAMQLPIGKRNVKNWAKACESIFVDKDCFSRHENLHELQAAGFDLKLQCRVLENYYSQLLVEEKHKKH